MIISEGRMQALIKKYVPEKYWAKPEGPIRSYMLVPDESMIEMCGSLKYPKADNTRIYGLKLDVAKMCGRDTKDHFVIMINKEHLLEDSMAFTILHEVGHVDQELGSEMGQKFLDDRELYADFYAYTILDDFLGIDRALDILANNCSKDGFGKKSSGDKTNAK